jgi:hypothetical protein
VLFSLFDILKNLETKFAPSFWWVSMFSLVVFDVRFLSEKCQRTQTTSVSHFSLKVNWDWLLLHHRHGWSIELLNPEY